MRIKRFLLVLFFSALASGFAQAHFNLSINIRVIHIEHLDTGLRVMIRVPMAYLVAHLLGPMRSDGTAQPAPYTRNQIENETLMHYVDGAAVRADPNGLAQFVADGHKIHVEGELLSAKIEHIRVYPALKQPPFASLTEAKRAFQENGVYPHAIVDGYVGDTVIDVALLFNTDHPIGKYQISSTLNPGLDGQEDTANLILDHANNDTLIFRETGLLKTAVEVSRSVWSAAYTFIIEGIKHILAGIDHVLFIVCLTIGAVSLGNLLLRVTGFTIGHTITLIAGFFGYVPSAAWFIPAVEAGIALSIVYAAVIAVTIQPKSKGNATTLWVTVAIGLLHGLGFSFVLHEILQVDAPNLWQSLLSFNLGVEIGQVAIVLACWPLLWWLSKQSRRWLQYSRWLIAIPCIAVATYWTSQRTFMVIQAFS